VGGAKRELSTDLSGHERITERSKVRGHSNTQYQRGSQKEKYAILYNTRGHSGAIISMKMVIIRIPAGGELTSLPFTQRGRGDELRTTENKSR